MTTSAPEKPAKPQPVKRRFIAKQRGKSWWVYDTERGSWPVQIPGAGSVSMAFTTEETCLVEADRCNREATG